MRKKLLQHLTLFPRVLGNITLQSIHDWWCWGVDGGYFYIGSNVRMGRGNRFRPLLMHEFRGVSVPPGLNLK